MIEMQEVMPWTQQVEEYQESLVNEWIVKWKDIQIHSLLERGTVGDFYRAKLRDQEVCLFLLSFSLLSFPFFLSSSLSFLYFMIV